MKRAKGFDFSMALLAGCAFLALPMIVSCAAQGTSAPEEGSDELPGGGGQPARVLSVVPQTPGAVYVQGDNAAGINQVYAFSRDPNSGALTFLGTFATGGHGSGLGDPQSGDHSVVLDGNLLFVTNGGPNGLLDLSGSVSVFTVGPTGGLQLADTKSTGGGVPVAVARHGNVVVALNSLDDSLQSYTLDSANHLHPATHVALNSNLLHGGAAAHPADVVFSASGTQVVVSERQLPASLALPDQAWFIDVLKIDPSTGALSDVVNNDVAALGNVGNLAAEPFALAIGAAGELVVTHGRYEIPGGGQEATYTINTDNTLTRTSLVPSGGFDDCWSTIVNTSSGGQLYYEQSFFDSKIRVAPLTQGTLGPFSLVATTSPTGLPLPGGIDVASTPSGTGAPVFLYSLDGAPNPLASIRGYAVDPATGALTPIGTFGSGQIGSISAVGIAAY